MKKNIMFIVPKLTGGGAEKTVANLTKILDKSIFNIYIVIFKETTLKYNYEGNLFCLKSKKGKHFFSNLIYAYKLSKELLQLKKDLKIDIAISFLTYADIINLLSKRKEKMIISIRNMDSILLNHTFLYHITKFCCKKADKIVAISKQVKEDIVLNFNIPNEKVNVIYNPIMDVEMCPLYSVDEEYIITVGRLTNQKGQWHLIRAFNEVLKVFPELKLYILGEGENEKYLKELVKNYAIEDNVYFLGFVNNPLQYLQSAKIFVFSSLYEGLGNSILEAIACNIPIISTDCDAGPREILSPETSFKKRLNNKIEYAKYGVLVPCFDGKKRKASESLTKEEKLLVESIITLLSNNDLILKYKKNSILRIKDFSPRTISEQWSEILNEKEEKL